MPFPSSVTPNIVAWFDGNQPHYADAAGTVPATAFRAPVRRINEASPLTGNWQAPDDAHGATRDLNGLRSDIIGPTSLVRSSAIAVSFRNSTIVLSFISRGNVVTGASQGLIVCRGGASPSYGCMIQPSSPNSWLGLYTNANALYVTGVPLTSATRTTLVIRYGATGVRVKKLVGGVTTDYTESPGFGAISTSSPPELFPALISGGFYGGTAQALVVDREINDTEATDIAVWADAQPLTAAYPLDGRLLTLLGDSITANAAGWSNSVLAALRPTYPEMDLCNQAVSGSFSANLSSQYAAGLVYYSPARPRNGLVIAIGTNDLNNSGITAEAVRDNTFSAADTARAAGYRVAIGGVLHRYYAGDSVAQAAFDAKRATLRAYMLANAADHSDAPYIDVAPLEAYPANNPTYFPDGLHPGPALYAPMGAVYQDSCAKLLQSGTNLVVERVSDAKASPPTFVFSLPH